MNLGLEGRTALVFGGSKGIGRAIAISLAREGVRVFIVSRSQDNLASAEARILDATGRKPECLVADLSVAGTAPDCVAQVIKRAGQIDILVNNAGGPPAGRLGDITDEAWDAAYALQLRAVVDATGSALPFMQAAGWGRIISVTTVLGMEPAADMMLSSTFRAAVSAFTKSVSLQVVDSGVTVNAICPSAVLTDRAREFAQRQAQDAGVDLATAQQQIAATLPMKRFAKDDEVGGLAAYLCSDLAGYITGRSLPLDGGVLRSYF